MNKQELINKIELIPKFVKRDVAIKEKAENVLDPELTYKWTEDEHHKAVTEEHDVLPLAFVSKNYCLVQFSEVFTSLLKEIEELEGKCVYYGGVGIMDVFPTDEKMAVNGDGDRIGIVAWNSVNKTSSVIVKFCIRHGDRFITIPKKIAGFKRMHTGKAVQITHNFLSVVGKVREVWKTILSEFEKVQVTEVYATTMLDEINLKDQNIRKKVVKRIRDTVDMNLWELFLYMMEVVEMRNYKSDVHRRKRLDRISDSIFRWAVASRLINA
jgi:hypothetical protein